MAIYRCLMSACGALAAVLLAAIVVVVLGEIIGRNTGAWTLAWSVEFSEYALVGATFIGAPWLLEKNGHVTVDILRNAFKGVSAQWLARVVNVLGALVCAVIAYYTWVGMLNLQARGAMVVKELVFPEWWTLVPVLLCFLLLCVGFLRRLVTGTDLSEAN